MSRSRSQRAGLPLPQRLAVRPGAGPRFATVLAPAAETIQWTVSDSSAAPSPADPLPAGSIREAFARSYAEENAKNYRQTIQTLEPLLDRADQGYLVSLRLGWLHYLSGDHEQAGRYYRAAIQAAPDATEPRVGYLLPLLAKQRYDEAQREARQVLDLDSANYYANLRLAYSLRLQGKLPEAEQVAKRRLKLQPTDVSLLSELALVYVAQERKSEAREAFEQILTLSPANSLARQQLGLPDAQPAPTEAPTPSEPASAAELSAAQELTAGCGCRPLTGGIAPYYASLDYGRESIKSHGNVWGVYGYLSAVNSLDADYEYTDLQFRDGFRLEQHDCTAVYSYGNVPNLKFRVGGHVIANNDPFSNGVWTGIAGAHWYQTDRWDIGADAYFTRYDGQSSNKSITQITPHLGIQQSVSDCLSLRLDLRAYYINTDQEVWGTGKEDFCSLEARLGLDRDWLGLIELCRGVPPAIAKIWPR